MKHTQTPSRGTVARHLEKMHDVHWYEVDDFETSRAPHGLFTHFTHGNDETRAERALHVTAQNYFTPFASSRIIARVYLTDQTGAPTFALSDPKKMHLSDLGTFMDEIERKGNTFTNVVHKIRATISGIIGHEYVAIIEARDEDHAIDIFRELDEDDSRMTFQDVSRTYTVQNVEILHTEEKEQRTAANIIDAISAEIARDGEQFTDEDVLQNILQIVKGCTQ